jgi:hypothetical protein
VRPKTLMERCAFSTSFWEFISGNLPLPNV